ncbi:MAG: MBL fold metallo-hydrolase [Halofilum sp. (in: g-proteobacteria)]
MAAPVQLTFLGCGDAFCSGGRFNTCFLVEALSTRFLIDCGATSLVALHRQGVSTDDIDAIMVTHFHGDHYGGLPFFFLEAAKIRKRRHPLTVVTPEGGEQRTRDLMEQLYPGTSGVMKEIDLRFVEYQGYQEIDIESLKLTAHPVIHAEASLPHGLRIEVDERVIGFSGDTEWTDELRSIADGAHLMICECNFFETQVPGHLEYQTLQRNLHQLNAGRIILNHLGQEMLTRLERVELTCAHDGMQVSV